MIMRTQASGNVFQPLFQGAMKTRHATESSLVFSNVDEIQNTLHLKAMWLGERGIPVQVWPWKAPMVVLRRIKSRLIYGYPKIFAFPQLGMGFMDSWRATIGYQRRMPEHRHPDGMGQ